MRRIWTRIACAGAMLALAGGAVNAQQVRTIDPNQAIDADLAAAKARKPATASRTPGNAQAQSATPASDFQRYPDEQQQGPATPASGANAPPPAGSQGYTPPLDASPQVAARDAADAKAASGETFQSPEILQAAEGVFGKGAAGLSGILERTLKEQGQPSAYIAGREAAGAVVVGLRYGKGMMYHKVEGQLPVYWTGPSVGFDVGGDATKVFVLVYNLYDSEALYRRFPAAEGRVYFVGGFAATYLRRGNIVLIPIRLGVGWRQGVNIGYMKFSHKSKWLPF